MIKSYRKRFVVSTLSLLGLVLIVAFSIFGFYTYKNDYKELQTTMSLVIRPLDGPNGMFRSIGDDKRPPEPDFQVKDREPGTEPPEKGHEPPEKSENSNGIVIDSEIDIITVFYNKTSGEFSLLSENESVDSDRIRNAVLEISESGERFGKSEEYGYVFCLEESGDELKVALVDSGYLSGRIRTIALQMFVIFAALMTVFFFITLWLSKIASRPMERAVEMERQFVADISHDLKTPITVILANNSIIKDSPGSTVADQRQWIDSTDNAAKNMMAMVGEMLTLSSLESRGREVELSKIDLAPIAEKSSLQLESVAYERGITVETDIAPEAFVNGNAEYAERICNGLLENALKYEPDGGIVEVKLVAGRKKTKLSFKNRGSVIESEDIDHIFERFYRGDKTRGIKKGHGLGLPIIKQMVDLLGAGIEVESSPGEGTVFTVTFDTE